MMFWYGDGWAFWQVALMWVGMVAFWGLLIWVIYAVVMGAMREPSGRPRGDDPRLILDQRLARGEIDVEEYRRLRDLIGVDERITSGGGGRP